MFFHKGKALPCGALQESLYLLLVFTGQYRTSGVDKLSTVLNQLTVLLKDLGLSRTYLV